MPDEHDTHQTAAVKDHVYSLLTASAITLIAIGTVVFHVLEDWSWVDSFYFSVVAVTTVGFGDLSPTTDGAKLFTVLYIVLGISLVATYLDARLRRHQRKRASRRTR